ncbi:MAG: hypothetical protein ACLFTK_01805 [Anaerolineales bacterium]
MPTYVFWCEDTQQRFEKAFKSIRAYETATVYSPYTGSANIRRLIDQMPALAPARADFQRLVDGDEQGLSLLDTTDTRTTAKQLRAMADETGADLGTDFDTIVERLAAGQTPAQVAHDMPHPSQDTTSDAC